MTKNALPDSVPRLSLKDFDFELPDGRIALVPARPRSAARLLVVDRCGAEFRDSRFSALDTHLEPGDVLVLNNTRVLNARVSGTLQRNNRRVEILFAEAQTDDSWRAMVRGGRRIRTGDTLALDDGSTLTLGEATPEGLREVRMSTGAHPTVHDLLESQGVVPLPPYIDRPTTSEDATDYQTTFATEPGAIAAPTAGLHFSPAVFESLHKRGIQTAEITLHVGIGTFTPVRTADPGAHVLREERYKLSDDTARTLNQARADRRRIIAVGTTTTRTLEYVFARHGAFVAGEGATDLYILPGHFFQAIDGLLTNFHLPRSTLLMLVAAFASRDVTLDAYRHAVASGYRFYSYGDCCLFL